MTDRVRLLGDAPIRSDRDYVLYWMTAFRRTRYNPSLDRAIAHAEELGKPLIVLEALRVDYPWASDRLHRFVMDGMSDQRDAFAQSPVAYHPYLEPERGHGAGLLEALATRASIVVTDDFPCFFLPRMLDAAAAKLSALGVAFEAVDGNGLYPTAAAEGRVFTRAFDFRRHLQRELPEFLDRRPAVSPLRRLRLPRASLPARVQTRWPEATRDRLAHDAGLAELPIDHAVSAASERGGERAARRRLKSFLRDKLARYGERNHPDEDVASGLSPYLHFGHLSAHEIFAELARAETWSPASLSTAARGSRTGWWGMSPPAEAFLDELVTWRELGFNFCTHRSNYHRFESLPDWARETLAAHAADERPHLYRYEQLERGETHDPIWNAAERQLVRDGRLHNYLRMLWGKKILEWSETPEQALTTMIELNNKYALDGRNPNSYSGIFWVLGRYDRAWGPERPIFGKVRYMSSENTKRKLRLARYLHTYGAA